MACITTIKTFDVSMNSMHLSLVTRWAHPSISAGLFKHPVGAKGKKTKQL